MSLTYVLASASRKAKLRRTSCTLGNLQYHGITIFHFLPTQTSSATSCLCKLWYTCGPVAKIRCPIQSLLNSAPCTPETTKQLLCTQRSSRPSSHFEGLESLRQGSLPRKGGSGRCWMSHGVPSHCRTKDLKDTKPSEHCRHSPKV